MDTPAGISTLDREDIFAGITKTTFDLLVIGGGIMGAGIALDAATRGLTVLLAEKQDFASGTSSRSTKLIHGGLRYLKNLEIDLVRTVASERKVLHKNAPHLILPEPMLIPVLQNASYGYWATKAGLMLYDFLGKVEQPEKHRMLNVKETLAQEPLLNPEKLLGAGLFTEYRTDDARLTLEVLKTAQQYGATCLNYCSVQIFTYDDDGLLSGAHLHDQLSGKIYKVKCRSIVNAAGPWSSQLMQIDQPEKIPQLVHTKGVHLVVPFRKLPLKQAVYFDIPGGRMLFAIPRNDITYLGTTDTPYQTDLHNPGIDKADADYILHAINQMFPEAKLTLEDVESGWAGVRTLLFEADKKPSEISRKDEIFVSGSGLISVAGGKLTGYRKLAEQVVNKVHALHFPGRNALSQTESLALSGGNFINAAAIKSFREKCEAEAARHKFPTTRIGYLVKTYGSNTAGILQKAIFLLHAGTQPENCLLFAEIWYTVNHEGTTSLSDFLIRRTGRLYFEREKIEAILPEVRAGLLQFLNLDNSELEKQEEEFRRHYFAAVAFKKEA